MYKKERLVELEEYFKKYDKRENNSIYFYRIEKYNKNLDEFFNKYLKAAQLSGVYFERNISSPLKNQIDYFLDIVGSDFKLEKVFIIEKINKWISGINSSYCNIIGESIYSFLIELREKGKNESILKNIYIKFMCWLYYKFKKLLIRNSSEDIPKIIYLGNINSHELEMLEIMSKIGCDILLLIIGGEVEYKKADPNLEKSIIYRVENGENYPLEFSLKYILDSSKAIEISENTIDMETGQDIIRTNNWIVEDIFQESLKFQKDRGTDRDYFYNILSKVDGVDNENDYINRLVQWKTKIEALGRKFKVFNETIELPSVEEVRKVVQKNCNSKKEAVNDLCKNIVFEKNKKIENIIRKSFIDILDNQELDTVQKVKNTGIVILCWLNRFIKDLINEDDIDRSSVFVFINFKGNKNENNFIKFISKLPVDIFILNPNLNSLSSFEDENLYTKRLEKSMEMKSFPVSGENIQVSTVAYNAERELDTLMYQGTGMYRRKQFRKAIPLTLKTTFEEISILWKEESKVRSGFDIIEDKVMVPTIFAKVSGVPEGNQANYWRMIENLVTKNTFLIRKIPFIKNKEYNPINESVHGFIKNKNLDIEKIKNHKLYKYGYLQEDVQDFILYGLQKLLDSQIIKGTFSSGAEYTIISTILNMDKKITRLIQNYDFTKEIPKVMLFSLREDICSLEDSILICFLNMIGFDILLFVPTGYQCLEKYYVKNIFLEHQVGEYLYDTILPNSICEDNDKKKGGILSWFKI